MQAGMNGRFELINFHPCKMKQRKSGRHVQKAPAFAATFNVVFCDLTSYAVLCLTEYPRIENAKESYLNWMGEYPAPKGSVVEDQLKELEGKRRSQFKRKFQELTTSRMNHLRWADPARGTTKRRRKQLHYELINYEFEKP
ncbi:unnamed protein product [Darwinula stevensoni]|uniref:Uncharacterized protein n=1 Tax=Darwinula stevensoni TaxID=69355 RepID=A0A7R9A6Q7_9CRUS|nr:unnamed protein product [Darwinula stevensoni]CAG0888588.1 unnamed protein product [Darwinula stevensoni]